MNLKTTSVAKCLDKRLLLFGFEVFDVLGIFLTLSVLNFVFGQTSFKIVFVWVPTALLAAVLHFGKKGKPDGFLIHWLRFQLKPGTFKAFPDASHWVSPPSIQTSELRGKR